jgi:uncharacterized protein (TIGR02996 family)
MREATWRAGKDPKKMLAWAAGRFSRRRLRLFACACASLEWEALPPVGRRAVEAAEAFADDPSTFAAMRSAGVAAQRVAQAVVCARTRAADAAQSALTYVYRPKGLIAVLHCQFGIPHRALTADVAWKSANDGAAVRLAREIYLNRTFDQLPILADALEDAGCSDADVLAHCRDVKEHSRGCWVLEMLLELEAGPGNPIDRLRAEGPAAVQRPAASRLFLPHSGWLVRVKATSAPELDAEALAQVRPWRDPPADEILLADPFDPADLETVAEVKSVKRVWFLTSKDPVPLPPRPSGRAETCGDVQTLLYTKQMAALDDLAGVHEPIRLLRELIAAGGSVMARKQAQAALAGDWRSLTALAETLRQSGHPRAAEVMWLTGAAAPVPPAPLPVAPVAVPAPGASRDPELEVAQAAATPCPQCKAHRFARRVRKPGPNVNRIFLSCSDRDCNSFEWVTSREQAARPAPPASVAAPAPPPDPILAAIRERPDDDSARRQYADALEKQGQAARAELVRVQCDLATLPPGDPAGLPLRKREFDLLAEHGDAWAAAVAPHVTRYEFRRGVLEHIAIDVPGFARDGAMLQGKAPVRSLSVRIRGWHDVRTVVTAPAFAMIRELELTGYPMAGAGARAVAEAVQVAGLISLRIPGGNLGRAGVEALSGSVNLSRLTRLDLSDGNIGKGGVAQIAASPPMSNLEALGLAGNNVSAAELEALLRSPYLVRLRSLDLSSTGFASPYLQALLEAPRLSQMRELRLVGAGGGKALTKRLAEADLSGLRALDLSDNKIDTDGLQILLSSRWRGLHTLSLANNRLDADAGKVLADWPGLESVRFLDLSGNRIGKGVQALLSSPHLGALSSLALCKCGITAECARTLADDAGLAHLTRLDLSENPLGKAGLTWLCRSTILVNLMDLSLRRTELDKGCGALLAKAEWSYLARLDLSKQPRLPASEWQALSRAGWLRRLRELDLSHTTIDDPGALALIEANPGNLRDLILVATDVGNRTGAALANWPGLSRLSKLDLGGAEVDIRSLQALAASQHLTRPGVVAMHLADDEHHAHGLQGDRRFVLTLV